MRFIYGFLFFCGCAFSSLYGQETLVDSSTGESFPKEVTFDQDGKSYQLEATGVATRKKLIIKVYSIAHYLQKGAAKPGADNVAAILSDDNAKQLTIKWVRGVGGDQVQESYQEALHKTFSAEEYAQLKSEIEAFLNFFRQGAEKGDVFVLRWLPGGILDVEINGKEVGSVSNKLFAKGLWSVWLGDNSVVNRKNLLSQLPQ